ncbi:hypothetical protein ARMSODRAFT_976189 [Armillaria solidipes]|uniref:Uncharacterized protein n=1 Tax=Armillaria solidipes TaxID=1076256 RepID=A0A2H3BN39_9AGAR|nr:hypothetical protein ARMSODRAFT_976189 [Armillaria solidipes]
MPLRKTSFASLSAIQSGLLTTAQRVNKGMIYPHRSPSTGSLEVAQHKLDHYSASFGDFGVIGRVEPSNVKRNQAVVTLRVPARRGGHEHSLAALSIPDWSHVNGATVKIKF